MADTFEQRARALGLSEDVTYYFPTYGGWPRVLRGWGDRGHPRPGLRPRRLILRG